MTTIELENSIQRILGLAKTLYQIPEAYFAFPYGEQGWSCIGDGGEDGDDFLSLAWKESRVCTRNGRVAIPALDATQKIRGLMVIAAPDRFFSPEEIQQLEVFAGTLSLNLQNQELYHDAQRKDRLATLGKVATEIVHEINNPVAIILGRVALMSAQVREQTPPREKLLECLEKVTHTAGRISKIIHGVKSFSRTIHSENFEQMDVAELIEYSLSFCSDRLDQSAVKLIVEKVPKKLKVNCQAVQFSQVLVNLVNNAIDATSKIEDRWIRISVKEEAERIQIQVVDCGNGIEAGMMEKIFQPFFTTKMKSDGTGLGLSISRNIVELHQGTLEYVPVDGHTAFTIKLPKAA